MAGAAGAGVKKPQALSIAHPRPRNPKLVDHSGSLGGKAGSEETIGDLTTDRRRRSEPRLSHLRETIPRLGQHAGSGVGVDQSTIPVLVQGEAAVPPLVKHLLYGIEQPHLPIHGHHPQAGLPGQTPRRLQLTPCSLCPAPPAGSRVDEEHRREQR